MSIFSRDHVIRYTLALSLALFAGCGSGSSGKPASDAGSTVPCTSDDACSGVCREGRCVPDPCSNGKKGGTETDVDCGGTCAPCAEGKACLKGQDCQSGVCRGGTCRAPSCDDGVTNAKETGTDCGGPDCEGCALDEPCEGDGDCKKGNCRDGTCKRAL
ncbi:MAG: hypothetical protein ABEL76_05620, partial [Bradymonadaceae bacterium]